MNKIAEAEKKKFGMGGKSRSKNVSTHMQPRTTGGFFIPFNQKFASGANAHSRQKSASFTATSRDAWATSHASKTNPPDVGKYKPKYSQVEPKGLSAEIRAQPKNEGADRIMQREL